MAEYLFQGNLDNTVHNLTYDHIRQLYRDNQREAQEGLRITVDSYLGTRFHPPKATYSPFDLFRELLYRDPKTAGLRIHYPHGVVLEQSMRRNYYRGENKIYRESVPSLLRALDSYPSKEERELYRLVADMRIAEFKALLQQFQHVREWNYCDILYDALAQHYGFQTGWLDITSDFNVALFFATCYYDQKQEKWLPLTKAQTEIDEKSQYGMIFHMPSNQMAMRWSLEQNKFATYSDKVVERKPDGSPHQYETLNYPKFTGLPENLIYPLGFQPFMRCHMQNGYGIYMRTKQPLQQDIAFEKLRFRHSERLSEDVYRMMGEGELIYPHEGLKQIQFIISDIATATAFSEEAFQYALIRSHWFAQEQADQCRAALSQFIVDGKPIEIAQKHPWRLSSGRKQKVNAIYKDFSLEKWYNIMVIERTKYPAGSKLFEPWMLMEEPNEPGIVDFRAANRPDCGSDIFTRDMARSLATLFTAKTQDF